MAGESSLTKKSSRPSPNEEGEKQETPSTTKVKKRTHWWFVLAAVAVTLVVVGIFAPTAMRNYAVFKAESNITTRDYEAAEDWLDWAGQFAPNDGEIKFLLARVYRKTGQFDEFEKTLSEAKQLDYSRERCRREEWLMEAQSGKMSEAELHLRELTDTEFNDSHEVAEAFTNGYLLTGRLSEAKLFLDRWEKDYPDDPQPKLMSGLVARQYGEREQAIAFFRQALEMQPGYIAAMLALADSLVVEREFEEAVSLYEQCTSSRFYRLDALSKLGMCRRRMGDVEEAKAPLEEALSIDPNHLHTLMELGNVEVLLQEYDSAVEHLESALAIEFRDGELRGLYASALRGVGRIEEAQEHADYAETSRQELDRAGDISRGITDSADNLDDRVEVGKIILTYGKEQEGLLWIYSALDIDPVYIPAHQTLVEFFDEKAQSDSRFERNAEMHRQAIEMALNPPTGQSNVPQQ